MPASYLDPLPHGVRLRLRVQPRAGRSEIVGESGGELRVRIAAPPVDDAANEALVAFLAETVGCRRSAVELIRGHKSRQKVVFIAGLDAATASARLTPAP